MKYIFLDVDGVLNNKNHYKKQHKRYGGRFCCESMPFNPRALRMLNKIITKVDGKIIITSSWRHSEASMMVLRIRLIEYGMRVYDIIDKDSYSCDRGKMIKKWLIKNGDRRTVLYADNQPVRKLSDQFIIIDDNYYDMLDYFDKSYIIKVNPKRGLTYFKALESIRKMLVQ